MSTVPFERGEVKKYLDGCIRFWRQKREESGIDIGQFIASCYIDAYQSVIYLYVMLTS